MKDLHTIVLLEFEANHTYIRIVREAMIEDVENIQIDWSDVDVFLLEASEFLTPPWFKEQVE